MRKYELTIKKPIKNIKCPTCSIKPLYRKVVRLRNKAEEVIWHCKNKDCHFFYPENFFDTYPQYEKFVERYP